MTEAACPSGCYGGRSVPKTNPQQHTEIGISGLVK